MPTERPRRLRQDGLRDLVRETRLSSESLIQPVFADATIEEPRDIEGLPGQRAWPVADVDQPVQAALDGGVSTVLLFGVPVSKDAEGSRAWAEKGVVQRSVARIREAFGDEVTVATDVCLCQYTDHGHCGLIQDGRVVDDATNERLAKVAASHARAGSDVVAPSAMMDGQVEAIRAALDEAGHVETAILSYSVKYASAFYGPFRNAAHSSPESGDRSGYQMDPANRREALREARLDVEEGADLVMVKPGLPYLDVIGDVAEAVDVPVAAYQVSGEAAQIQAAADRGDVARDEAVLESLLALRRAGADVIVTYFARELEEVVADVE